MNERTGEWGLLPGLILVWWLSLGLGVGSGYWAGGQFSRSQPLTCCVTLGKLPSLAGPQLPVCKVEAIPPIC